MDAEDRSGSDEFAFVAEVRRLNAEELCAKAEGLAGLVNESSRVFGGMLKRMAIVVAVHEQLLECGDSPFRFTPWLIERGLSRGNAASVGALLPAARLFLARKLTDDEWRDLSFADALNVRTAIAQLGVSAMEHGATVVRLRLRHPELCAPALAKAASAADPYAAAEALALGQTPPPQSDDDPPPARESVPRRARMMPAPQGESASAGPLLCDAVGALIAWATAHGGVPALKEWSRPRAEAALAELAPVEGIFAALREAAE